MLRRHWKLTGLAAVILAGLALCIGALAGRQMADDETTVTMEQVPGAVRTALLGQGGTIQEIEMQTEDGQTVYEADIIVDGRKREVKLAADGSLIGKESDDEDNGEQGEEEEHEQEEEEDDAQVSLEQVPDPVKATIRAEAQGGTIEEIEQENEDGQAIYEADVLINGQKVELKVAQDSGKLIGKEVDDEETNDDED
jgi:uncharacterized membrane protein YkoI